MKKVLSLREMIIDERKQLDAMILSLANSLSSIRSLKSNIEYAQKELEKLFNAGDYSVKKTYTKEGEKLKKEIDNLTDSTFHSLAWKLYGHALSSEIEKNELYKQLDKETKKEYKFSAYSNLSTEEIESRIKIEQQNIKASAQEIKEINNQLKALKKLEESHCKNMIAYNKLLKSKNMFDLLDEIGLKVAYETQRDKFPSVTSEFEHVYSNFYNRKHSLNKLFDYGNTLHDKVYEKLDAEVDAHRYDKPNNVSSYYSKEGFQAFISKETKKNAEYWQLVKDAPLIEQKRSIKQQLDQKYDGVGVAVAEKELEQQ